MIAASRHAPLVAAALAGMAGNVEPQPAGCWDLRLGATPVSARLDDAWLLLSAPVPATTAMLARNGALSGHVKFVLSENGELQLRAEVPLDEDAEPLIRAAWAAMESALAALRGEAVPTPVGEAEPALAQDAIARLCAEAGWPATLRSDGSCAVEIESPGAFVQASLTARGAGLRAAVQLASLPAAATASVSAVSRLLLIIGGVVRLARPAMNMSEGRALPRLEVTFSSSPAADALAHALASLSVAHQLCAEEARALHDPNLAGEFLALSNTTTRKETT